MRLFLVTLFILSGMVIGPLHSIPETIQPVEKKEKTTASTEELEWIRRKVFLMLESGKEEVYVNEITPLTVKLLANGPSMKDIQYPKLFQKGFLVAEFDPPIQKQEIVKGILFKAWEFKTTISGEKPGDYLLGPAELQCLLQLRREEIENPPSGNRRETTEDYFGTYDALSLNLESGKIKIRVMPFPTEGKPQNFSGAVGDFHFTMEVNPKEVIVGSPITLKMTIGGKGNFSSITAPTIGRADDFKVYQPKVLQKDSLRIFEQVLIPSKEVKEIPGVRFSFFDPDKKVYRTLYHGPLPIKVSKPDVVQGKREILDRDIIYIKDSPGRLKVKGEFLYRKSVFLAIQLLGFLLFASLFFLNRRREKMRTDLRYAGKQRASKNAKKGIKEAQRSLGEERAEAFYNVLFKTLQNYLGEKFQIPPGGITGRTVDQELRLRGVDENLCEDLKTIFEECDNVRYGSSAPERSKMEETLQLMRETVRHLEKQRL